MPPHPTDLLEGALGALSAGDEQTAEAMLADLPDREVDPRQVRPMLEGLLVLADLRGRHGGSEARREVLERAFEIARSFTEVPLRVRGQIALALAMVSPDRGEARALAHAVRTEALEAAPPDYGLAAQASYLSVGLDAGELSLEGLDARLEECVRLIDQAGGADVILPLVLADRAGVALETRAPVLARRLMERAVKVADDVWDVEDPRLVKLLTGFATLQASDPEVPEEQIASHLRRAYTLAEDVFGPTHPEVAQVLLAKARLALERGDPGRALPMLGKALWILQRAETDPVTLANAHNTFGVALHRHGDTPEALDHFREALRLLDDAKAAAPALRRFVASNLERAAAALSRRD